MHRKGCLIAAPHRSLFVQHPTYTFFLRINSPAPSGLSHFYTARSLFNTPLTLSRGTLLYPLTKDMFLIVSRCSVTFRTFFADGAQIAAGYFLSPSTRVVTDHEPCIPDTRGIQGRHPLWTDSDSKAVRNGKQHDKDLSSETLCRRT